MSDGDEREDEQQAAGRGEPRPPYLREVRELSLRRGGEIVKAPPEDVAVANGYATWGEKGEVVGGVRLTILSKKKRYGVGEEVRVIHVMEVVEPGQELFVMGPKPVYGEHVDDRPVTPQSPGAEEYDGLVLESPNVDYNYDITSYSFPEPGRHTIYWQPGRVRSNTLEIEVEA